MQKRNQRSPEFKKKAAIAALKEDSTANEIAKRFGIHVILVHKWKKELLEKAKAVFETNAVGPFNHQAHQLAPL